jgi:hypothetical protein
MRRAYRRAASSAGGRAHENSAGRRRLVDSIVFERREAPRFVEHLWLIWM